MELDRLFEPPCPLCGHRAITTIGARAHWAISHGWLDRAWYQIRRLWP